MEKAVAGTLAAGFGKVCQTTHVGLPHMFGLPIAAGGGWAPTFNRICCGSHMSAKSYQGTTSSQQLATAALIAQSTAQENRTISRILELGKNLEPSPHNSMPVDDDQAKGISIGDGLPGDVGRNASSTFSSSMPERTFPYLQTPSVAQLVQADWQGRLMRLEQGFYDVSSENDSLRGSLQAAHKMNGDAKELNLRLTKEVQRARREEAGATQQVQWLEEEVQRLRQKCHSLSKDLRTARRKSAQRSSAPDGAATWTCASTNATEQQPETTDSSQQTETGFATADVAAQPVQTSHSSSQTEDNAVDGTDMFPESSMDACKEASEIQVPGDALDVCRCDSTFGRSSGETSWGCACHQVYSLPLLLAHRSMSISVARGAPGLESTMAPVQSHSRAPVARALL